MRATSSTLVAMALSVLTLTGPPPFAQVMATIDELNMKAMTEGSVRVIVGVDAGVRSKGVHSESRIETQQAAISQAQDDVLGSLTSQNVGSVRRFSYVPYLAMEVDADALAELSSHPSVTSIQEDVPVPPTLGQSVPLINADDAWLTGFSGAGQTIAILDTGVQGTHEFLTGKVVSEACFSTTTATSTTVCPNGLEEQIGAGAGVNCNLGTAGCNHGTHVAGIAAGSHPASGRFGVARGANIIAIQVFSQFTGASCTNLGLPSPCVLTFTSDQMAGLDRVFALRNTFNIAAVNMSLGGGQFTSNCDTDARKPSIDNLRAADIATVIASGNSGFTNALGAPACISTAISVGATEDGSSGTTVDRVASFSNSASFLHLLAPGQWINSSVPGVGTYADFRGTSMAAPHVAGAWAILKSAVSVANVTEVLMALQATGVAVTDTRNSITKPRIQVQQALDMLLPMHPRMTADVNADGRADIVGFGDAGAYVSLSTGTGFTAPQLWVNNFGYSAGGWRVGLHPRLLADVNADGRADIVGFGDAGAYVSLSTGTDFTAPQLWVNNFGYSAGGWRVGLHPRLLADVNADGRADIVGFGDAGAYVSLSTGTDFTAPQLWVNNFGYSAGGWRVGLHPRLLADVNADGRADIVGFGDAGAYVSLSTGTDFTAPQLWVNNFGYSAGGWRIEAHPRLLADVNADGRADIVGFGDAGAYVSLSTGTGFTAPQLWVNNFGYSAGGWRIEAHPRLLADVNADRRADIVGFGDAGAYVSLSTGTGFTAPQLWVNNFGYSAGGWRVGLHPRLLANVNGGSRADIVGFGDAGAYVSLSTGTSFIAPQLWVNNYGYNAGWR